MDAYDDKPGMLDAIREFLKEHPEHIPEFRSAVRNGVDDVFMSTDGMIAFTEWTIKKGYGNTAKAKQFRKWIKEKTGK